MINQWLVKREGFDKDHAVIYRGAKENGAFMVLIDNNYQELMPNDNKAEFILDGTHCYIRVLPGSLRADLFVNDTLQQYSDKQLETQSAPEAYTGKSYPPNERKHASSFMSFVIFSFVNIALTFIGSSIYFPFSCAFATYSAILGKAFLDMNESGPGLAMIALALVSVGIFFLLYVLSKTRRSCVLIALMLVLMDLAVVILVNREDIASGIIDIAFHAWVIYALLRLFQAKKPKEYIEIE